MIMRCQAGAIFFSPSEKAPTRVLNWIQKAFSIRGFDF
jgi:hypothetical protein